jgi:hypothetical protein
VNENDQGFELPQIFFSFLEDAVGFQARLLKFDDGSVRLGHGCNVSSRIERMLLLSGTNTGVVVQVRSYI